MGIAILTASSLFAPLQNFVSWLSRPGSKTHSKPEPCAASALARSTPLRDLCEVYHPERVVRPLRVIRTIDKGAPLTRQNRLVISGRIQDVCAELDRLAALEAQNDQAQFRRCA